MTTGNHVWDKREALTYIGAEPRLLRPLNMASAAPGRGVFVARMADGRPLGVINAMGRVFMPPVDNPFEAVAAAVDRLSRECRIILVDMHAEATAEKIAMGWHLDGRVAAVVGTHTHVQTADARVLPGGTAYITDVGHDRPARFDHRHGARRRARPLRHRASHAAWSLPRRTRACRRSSSTPTIARAWPARSSASTGRSRMSPTRGAQEDDDQPL